MTYRQPKHILVAVDFGEASAAAVTMAGRLAAQFGATLAALHAEQFELPPYFTREQFARLEGELRAARRTAEATLRRFVAAHTSTVATAHVVERPPAEAVLEASATADLVVLGTHGRRGPKRWWLGSVAERVVREAPVPVMVVHAGDDAARSEPREVIVLGDPPAPEVLEWAEAIAAAAGVTVRQGPPVDQCASAGASSRAVMAVPLEQSPAGKTVHPGLAALARDCPAPVLFVPVPRYAETIA